MPLTTNYHLRYPAGTDTVNASSDLQNLATDTDTALQAVANPAAVIATRTTTQSISTATFTDVTFPNEELDTENLFTAGAATVTADLFGVYHVTANIQWANNSTGTRALILLVNGVEVPGVGNEVPANAAAAFGTRLQLATDVNLSPGNTVKVQAYQSSGGALNILNARLTFRYVVG